MKRAAHVVRTQAINVALCILLLTLWLGLTAYLDAKPSETDALQAASLDLIDARADAKQMARNARRVQP